MTRDLPEDAKNAMQHFFYKAIPTVKQFQSDSSVTFAVRGEDKILKHLDWLLERYHLHSRKLNADLQRIILCEIFLGANYWIRAYHEKKPSMKKERYPAVLALFEAAVGQLSTLLRCSRPMVAIQIEEIFGRELMPEGAKTDAEPQTTPEYFTAMQLELYRIRFRAGRAHHAGLDATRPMHLTPLDTAPFFFEIARKGTDGKQATMNKGWGPFVMTMEREFYMTKHWFDTPGHKNIFHSSYTHGRAISAAGTMYAEHGIIKGVRPDSGHYKPLEHNIVSALLALQMFAVRMATSSGSVTASPFQVPIRRHSRTMLNSFSVRPPFSPRFTGVSCSLSNTASQTVAGPPAGGAAAGIATR